MSTITYLRLDKEYDPLFDTKAELSDLYAVAQAIYTRLMLFQGEWWEDLNEGTPWFQQILGYRKKTVSGQLLATTALTARIMGTPYVSSVTNIQITQPGATQVAIEAAPGGPTFGFGQGPYGQFPYGGGGQGPGGGSGGGFIVKFNAAMNRAYGYHATVITVFGALQIAGPIMPIPGEAARLIQ